MVICLVLFLLQEPRATTRFHTPIMAPHKMVCLKFEPACKSSIPLHCITYWVVVLHCIALALQLCCLYDASVRCLGLPFHVNSTEHSIIIQAASQWVLCFSGSLPIALIYLWLIIFFLSFWENKYDDDDEDHFMSCRECQFVVIAWRWLSWMTSELMSLIATKNFALSLPRGDTQLKNWAAAFLDLWSLLSALSYRPFPLYLCVVLELDQPPVFLHYIVTFQTFLVCCNCIINLFHSEQAWTIGFFNKWKSLLH